MSNKKYEGLSFVFDIDGTICPIKKKDEKYEDLIPFPEMIKKLREYHSGGAKIILLTARNMNSYQGNIGRINANTARILLAWLDKWEIPHDEIYYGKPWPGHFGFYVDDRSVRPDEFMKFTPDEMERICVESRLKR